MRLELESRMEVVVLVSCPFFFLKGEENLKTFRVLFLSGDEAPSPSFT